MIVSSEPTVVDFVVVIEATASMVTHWNAIKKNYIRPSVEYFNGRPLSQVDYIGNNGSSQFACVLFHAADSSSDLVTSCSDVTHSSWDFVCALDSITFNGGGCEKCSHVAEGLGRALQLFDDLSEKRGRGKSKKVCFLVCNSPPYDLPCYDNYIYLGQTYEKLAEHIGAKGINLSVISPQRIRELKQIYRAANPNNALVMNYAQDHRHLVLISGFTLPTEQDPVKLESKSEILVNKSSAAITNGSKVNATSSVPSPLVQHPSPLSTLNNNNCVQKRSPGDLLQQPMSQSSSILQDIKPSLQDNIKPALQDIKPPVSLTITPSDARLSGSMSVTSQPANGLGATTSNKPPGTMLQAGLILQQQAQQQNASTPNISLSRASTQSQAGANSLAGNLMTIKTEHGNVRDMLQQSLPQQQQSVESQMRHSGSSSFPAQQGSNLPGNMRLNSSGALPVNSMPQGGNQTLFSPQSSMQNAGMHDTQMITLPSGASLTAALSSTSMPQAPPYSSQSLNSGGMQGVQSQQQIPVNSVSSAGNTPNFVGAQGNSQINPRVNIRQGMVQVNPQAGQKPQLGNNMNMLSSMSNNSPMNSLTNNDQSQLSTATTSYSAASNVANAIMLQASQAAAQQSDSRILWCGNLEWKEKRKIASGSQERTVYQLRCEVWHRSNQMDDSINSSLWPSMLSMQLVPQVVFTYRDIKLQMKNHVSVSLRMSPNDQMMKLANTMQSKWMGVIQIPLPSHLQATESKVIIMVYSAKNSQFFGLMPREPANFINTLRHVIMIHQNTQRSSNSMIPQNSAQPNVELPSFSQDASNRMNQPNVQTANQFPMQTNARGNLNTGPIRPVTHLQQTNRSVISNSNVPVGSNVQMQTVVNNPQQRMMEMNYGQQPRMTGSNQMGNQPIANPQMQQQSGMGQQMQQGSGNQQFMYQNNINMRQMAPQRPSMNQTEMVRQQQLQRMRLQQQQQQQQHQQQQQQQQQQNQQLAHNRMNQMPGGDEQLRSLLQGSSNMAQGMNQPRPNMHPTSQGMRQVLQSQMRPGYMPNQQMHHRRR